MFIYLKNITEKARFKKLIKGTIFWIFHTCSPCTNNSETTEEKETRITKARGILKTINFIKISRHALNTKLLQLSTVKCMR